MRSHLVVHTYRRLKWLMAAEAGLNTGEKPHKPYKQEYEMNNIGPPNFTIFLGWKQPSKFVSAMQTKHRGGSSIRKPGFVIKCFCILLSHVHKQYRNQLHVIYIYIGWVQNNMIYRILYVFDSLTSDSSPLKSTSIVKSRSRTLFLFGLMLMTP